METTRTTLPNFNGEINVSEIKSEKGISYLSQSTPFVDEVFKQGAVKVNTFESEKKHVLFLFNAADAEVGRYYMCQSLQGKTPQELKEIKHSLVIFKSWNPNANEGNGAWIPCVSQGSQESLAASATML